METKWDRRRHFVKNMLDIGVTDNIWNRSYDILYTASIIINLLASIMLTYDEIRLQYGGILKIIEIVTVALFTLDYILRIWTAKFFYGSLDERGVTVGGKKPVLMYMLSFTGIIDLMSFLPYWLPVFFPTGAATFRMFRVVRIFRLFRINAYYDSLNVITEVLISKAQQLVSSVFIISILMVASSLCMYSLEHEAQPEVFKNAFSGIWWSVSTLLTVGYGDIYPITTMGKIFSIFITFLGVGMVAIPTGIISAGFVDQYSRIKKMSEYAAIDPVNFIQVEIKTGESWVDKKIKELGIPRGILVVAIHRNGEVVVPRGDTFLEIGDILVLGAETFDDNKYRMELQEIIVKDKNEWAGLAVRDLPISRNTVIVMIKRKNKTYVPNGNFIIRVGDRVVTYSKYINSHSKVD